MEPVVALLLSTLSDGRRIVLCASAPAEQGGLPHTLTRLSHAGVQIQWHGRAHLMRESQAAKWVASCPAGTSGQHLYRDYLTAASRTHGFAHALDSFLTAVRRLERGMPHPLRATSDVVVGVCGKTSMGDPLLLLEDGEWQTVAPWIGLPRSSFYGR